MKHASDVRRACWRRMPHSTRPETKRRPRRRVSNASAFPIAQLKVPSAVVYAFQKYGTFGAMGGEAQSWCLQTSTSRWRSLGDTKGHARNLDKTRTTRSPAVCVDTTSVSHLQTLRLHLAGGNVILQRSRPEAALLCRVPRIQPTSIWARD
jgi:hypothetical protein